MPVLIATRTVRIGRTEYKPGDSFEASDRDAKTWVTILKKARFSDVVKPKAVDLPKEVMSRAPVKETKVEVAETTEVKAEEPVEAPKRHYRRRDMSADQD